jgi:HEAT repeat protein
MLLLASVASCEANQPPPKLADDSPASPPTPICISTGDAYQRFIYVAEREHAHDIASARAALESLLASCDASVRTKALEWLLHLPRVPQPLFPPAPNPLAVMLICPGPAVWDQRFEYERAFSDAGDTAAALTLLQSALDDCDASVRQKAAERLKLLPSPPLTTDCPERNAWAERFSYSDLLKEWKQFDAARTVLIGALADCNLKVRGDALS